MRWLAAQLAASTLKTRFAPRKTGPNNGPLFRLAAADGRRALSKHDATEAALGAKLL
jgi:hypothetical protein